jgi:very-short-patch-repair endonuclease
LAEAWRKSPTRAERLLWRAIKNKQLAGYAFRRQQVIAGFIVDFYCARARLVVEVDGPCHQAPAQRRRDQWRTGPLELAGVRVLRIENEAIYKDLGLVLRTIAEACGGESVVRYGHSPRQR